MFLALVATLSTASADNVLLKTFGMDLPTGLEELPGRRIDGHLILSEGGSAAATTVPWLHAGYGRLDPLWAYPGRQRVSPPACTGFKVLEKGTVTIDGFPAQVTIASARLADGSPVVVYDAVAKDRHGAALFVVEAVFPAADKDYWLRVVDDTVASVDLVINATVASAD